MRKETQGKRLPDQISKPSVYSTHEAHLSNQSRHQESIERKVVVLGNSGTGKSALIRNFINGTNIRSTTTEETIGAERYFKEIEVYVNPVLEIKMKQRLQIWDTSG